MLRRALALLVVATLAVLGLAAPALAATTVPGAADLQATTASNGVRLSWQPASSGTAATSFEVWRGTSADHLALLAKATSLYGYGDRLSSATAPSTTYFYAVRGINATGTGPFSNTASAGTPAAALVPPATQAAVFDDGGKTDVFGAESTWRAGATDSYAGVSLEKPDAMLTMSVYPPDGQTLVGSFPVQDTGHDATHGFMSVGRCTSLTGAVTVHDVVSDVDGKAVVLDLDADITCAGKPTTVAIRIGTDRPYTAISAPAVTAGLLKADAPHQVVASYSNVGTAPVTVSGVTVGGSGWAAGPEDSCTGATLAAGQSCQVSLSVTPALGENPGTITWADSTAAGTHARSLSATGVKAPAKPGPVGGPRRDGKITLMWNDLGGTDQRASSFNVYRGPDADHLTLLDSVAAPATYTSAYNEYTDPDTDDGVRFYAIEAVNDAGPAMGDPWEADFAFRAPTGLTGTASASKTEIAFEAPTGIPPNPRFDYVVYMGTAPTNLVQVATTTTTTWGGLTPAGATHVYVQVAQALENGAVGPRTPVLDLPLTTTELVTGPARGIVTSSLTGGPGTTLLADSFIHPDLAVSPNGQWLAYTTTDGTSARQLWLAKMDGSVVAPIANTAADEYAPSWSPDGRSVSYSRDDGTHLTVCRTAVSAAGGGPCTSVVQDEADEASWLTSSSFVATGYDSLVRLTTAGATSPIAGTAGGYQPSVSPDGTQAAFLVPSADGMSEVIKVVNLVSGAVRALPTPGGLLFSTPSWTRDGSAVYVVGGTDTEDHVYRIGTTAGGTATMVPGFADDQYAVAVATPDTVAPVSVKLTGVPAVTLGTSVTPTFSATDATNGIASYAVSYRRAAVNSGYSAATVKTLTKPAAIAVSRGYSYCFSVRATDRAGNTSAPTPEQCVMVPLDDRSLTRSSGFAPVTSSAYYAGTATKATAKGQTLTRTGVTSIRQLTVIGTACPTCGVVDVLVAGRKVGAVSFASRTTVNHKAFTLPAFSVRSGTVQLKVTSSGKPVVVDGLGFRK